MSVKIFFDKNVSDDLSYVVDFCLIPNEVIRMCKSKSGTACDIPFVYQGQRYDTCINVDSGGERWCYTNVTDKKWETCSASSCDELNGKVIAAENTFSQYIISHRMLK